MCALNQCYYLLCDQRVVLGDEAPQGRLFILGISTHACGNLGLNGILAQVGLIDSCSMCVALMNVCGYMSMSLCV